MTWFQPSLRWRLAAISALLTFGILLVFALAVGQLTAARIKSDFDNALAADVNRFLDQSQVTKLDSLTGTYEPVTPDVNSFGDTMIRVLDNNGLFINGTKNAPDFPVSLNDESTRIGGYRVETRQRAVPTVEDPQVAINIIVQYARKTSDIDATIAEVRLFLALGVIAGTILSLVAGLVLAHRAMKPIGRLTATARDIARTRDPNQAIPVPDSDDEVAELAQTLDDMLKALSTARSETESTLARQRQFVADASHELRTPLTSVLANLELLAAELDGEPAEAAKSALRSSHRMRRLVTDLLLLARTDAAREVPHSELDLGRVLIDVAAELGPVTAGHDLEIDAGESRMEGAPDDLHRLALNLVENAIHHTPPGTRVLASTSSVNGDVVLQVEDDGPGIPEDVRDRLFERFVRSGDDHAGSFGLGLSIVDAVARSHGGSVAIEEPPTGGARFVVRLPKR